MHSLVLDTDVCSRSIKHQLSPVMSARLAGRTWCVSFVTVGELWQWAELRNWGLHSRNYLDDWLAHVVVLDSDDQVSRTWARIASAGYQRGRPRPANDTWIAATCLARGLPLATYNIKDYADFAEYEGLTLVTG